MFYTLGPRQVYIQEKTGKKSIVHVRRALDWEGNVIPNLLCTDTGRYFIKLRWAAVDRTFTREEPSAPLLQCQFKAKDGNGLNFSLTSS